MHGTILATLGPALHLSWQQGTGAESLCPDGLLQPLCHGGLACLLLAPARRCCTSSGYRGYSDHGFCQVWAHHMSALPSPPFTAPVQPALFGPLRRRLSTWFCAAARSCRLFPVQGPHVLTSDCSCAIQAHGGPCVVLGLLEPSAAICALTANGLFRFMLLCRGSPLSGSTRQWSERSNLPSQGPLRDSRPPRYNLQRHSRLS